MTPEQKQAKIEEMRVHFREVIEKAVQSGVKLIQRSFKSNGCFCLITHAFPAETNDLSLEMATQFFFKERYRNFNKDDGEFITFGGYAIGDVYLGWDTTDRAYRTPRQEDFILLGRDLRAYYVSLGGK